MISPLSRFLLLLAAAPILAGSANEIVRKELPIPNVPVLDQDGRQLHFFDDLIKDKNVVVNFIFTSCPTVCPPMGANFGALQKQLKARGNKDVSLISVSIDPVTDTPQRLKAWRARFGGGPGWDLVTGQKQDITKILKMLNVFSADINTHSPFVIMNDGNGWRYLNGLTPPEQLADLLERRKSGKKSAQTQRPAAHYFPDTVLTDQHGKKQRFYTDLIKDKVIVVNTFFTSCQSVCPKTMGTLAEIQKWLGDRLGKEVHILSVSVDPITDTPEELAAYAQQLQARPGWFLLTGSPPEVRQVLQKIGQFTEHPEGHSNVFIMGNEPTGLWKKAMGLAPPETVIPILETVVDDRG